MTEYSREEVSKGGDPRTLSPVFKIVFTKCIPRNHLVPNPNLLPFTSLVLLLFFGPFRRIKHDSSLPFPGGSRRDPEVPDTRGGEETRRDEPRSLSGKGEERERGTVGAKGHLSGDVGVVVGGEEPHLRSRGPGEGHPLQETQQKGHAPPHLTQ